MRLSAREQIIQSKARNKPTQTMTFEEFRRAALNGTPRPTQGKFLDSPAEFKAYKGMAGVAKTSTICEDILERAFFQPGVKLFVARYDYNKLLGTTAKRLEEMINRVAPGAIIDRDKTPPMKWYIQQPMGTIAEIDFIGLKAYPGSYEWHYGVVDEADECEQADVEGLKSRLRAPPYKDDQGVTYPPNYGMSIAFNPPDEVHWLFKACTGIDSALHRKVDEPTFELFEPAVGENDANLPQDYFLKNFRGLPQDMIDRLRWGKWGANFPGKAVYLDHFYTHHHVRDTLETHPFLPMFRFMDFGYRHPACLWVQCDEHLRFRVLREYLGENEDAKSFAMKVHLKTAEWFPGFRSCVNIGDPAAKQEKDTGSTLAVLADAGIELVYREDMDIEAGLVRVRYVLGQMVKGEPMMLISRVGCPMTVRGMQGGYHRHKTTNKPVKDGYYDHLMDALRYGVTNMVDHNGAPIALPQADTNHALTGGVGGHFVPDHLEFTD